MTTHTPGPWGIRFDDFDNAWHVYPKPDAPPQFGEWSALAVCGLDDDEDEANARLIAAAPDLLAAAKAVLAGLEVRIAAADPSAVPMFDGIADLHAAISKAQEPTNGQ